MIIRKALQQEQRRMDELFSIAFEFAADLDEKSPPSLYRPSTSWAAFEDDDATMMCYFHALDFPIYFDGQIHRMTGIGGVSSLPQYRRRGGIRGCFETALPDMYQNGYSFSYLYPFSTSYYRKFGYEMGCETLRYHINLKKLKHFSLNGTCVLTEPGNYMSKEIQEISSIWQQRYNMMVQNEIYEYQWIEKVHPVKNQEFTYVYLDSTQSPKGYMTLKQNIEESGRNLLCTRFCFTNAEGIKGLLNLAAALGSDHDYITFDLPSDVDISLLIPEWAMAGGKREKNFAGMVRVINVKKVLEEAAYVGSGELFLHIIDSQISENNGIFHIQFENGKAFSVALTPREHYDIKMNIHHFSRLIIGACDTDTLEYMEDLDIPNAQSLEHIQKVFYRKPNYISEYF